MPRKIVVQVDTSSEGNAIDVIVHDAVEQFDISRREVIFRRILDAVKRACGTVIESGYDTERSLFGIWNTWFIIPSEAHNDQNRKHLHNDLAQIYRANSRIVRGFRLVWEGDRQDRMVGEIEVAISRFGEASFNLDPEFLKHLQCYSCGSEIDHFGFTEKDAKEGFRLNLVEKDTEAYERLMRSIGGECQNCSCIVCTIDYQNNQFKCPRCGVKIVHFHGKAS
jgi:hypothetical protein